MPRLMPLVVRHAPAICAALFFAFGLVAALAVPARGADLNRTDRLFLRPHGLPELRASAPVIAGDGGYRGQRHYSSSNRPTNLPEPG